ncbi:hypothetical protein PVBG_06032 [Plasmodium vivax Brazil I]|uniref:VIR protein n=2 Tax=Plasmodium vivax TaxID=5855 RepID=A0A565A6P1_PLAVI|nr:hypothetical protein PVBG_06032 [Plasmodium vivax Brazil I]VVA00267.1 PIR protein [Plasmodium vivax]
MQGWRGTFSGTTNALRGFEQRTCIRDYAKLKSEIEKEIEAFNTKKHKDFYKEWDKINKNIIQKNNEISYCVNKGHVSVDLINLDNIKNFRLKCPNRYAPTCSNSSPSQVRKSPASKKTVSEESCKASKGCNKEITATELEKGKSQSISPEVDSKTVRSPGADPKHQHQKNSIRQDQRNTNIISQLQPSVSRSDPLVVAEVKESEQSDNGGSTSPNREEAHAQTLPVVGPSKENTFENHPRDQQLQSATTVESDSGDSSQVRDSDENTPQSETLRDEKVGVNTTDQQSKVVTVPPRDNVDGQAVATNTRVPESAAEGVSPNQNNHQGDRISASTGNLSSPSAELDTRNDNHTGSVTTNSEPSPVETACTEASSDQASGSETPCSNREDSELFNDNGNILDRLKDFFESIPNNERVIKTSAPIGIALLLGLLFKFTPLWRVLTKKNRKKGAVINEELNSVLQEPSIMDDERSIPFSYGAFEYSTFDQNVY